MSKLDLTLILKDLDFLAPLACGDVQAEGINLNLVRDTPGALDRFLNDPSLDAGETSFSRHLIRLSQGDRGIIGLPFFAYRGFRHRCFYVRRDSGLRELAQLQGKRLGTNEWPASGNVWSRALLREQGVPLESITWWVGPVDNLLAPRRPQGALPAYARPAPADRTLREMLLAGELEALMCPQPPQGFYEESSPIVRLYPDYRRVEKEYYQRVGFYPPHHIVGLRAEVFQRAPWVAQSLYRALDASRLLWQERRRVWAEFSPWMQAEIEEVTALMGRDWQPSGVEANRRAIQAFCDEEFAQGLIAQPLDPDAIFAEFEQTRTM